MKFKDYDIGVYYPDDSVHYRSLIVGESYTVVIIDVINNYICVGRGDYIWYDAKYFITQCEWREMKINRLIEGIDEI